MREKFMRAFALLLVISIACMLGLGTNAQAEWQCWEPSWPKTTGVPEKIEKQPQKFYFLPFEETDALQC